MFIRYTTKIIVCLHIIDHLSSSLDWHYSVNICYYNVECKIYVFDIIFGFLAPKNIYFDTKITYLCVIV